MHKYLLLRDVREVSRDEDGMEHVSIKQKMLLDRHTVKSMEHVYEP